MTFNLTENLCLAPEDGAGSGDGAGDSTNDSAGSADGSEGSSALYRPDGLAEEYHGETDQDTIDRLHSALTASKPSLPDDITGYDFTPSDELKDFFQDKDDPVLNAAKAAALDVGIPPNVLQDFINKTFSGPVGEGLIAPPFDPKKEMDTLAGYMKGDAKAAERAIKEAETVAGNIADRLNMPEGAKAFMEGMAEMADGIVIIRSLQELLRERGISLGGREGGSDAHMTREQLKALGADPRIDPRSGNYDPALRKQYDESYQALFPS